MARDPYEVLGVSNSAGDEEIKAAYRELVRKYHPDNYVNNPLADLAQEKMKEINEAYDTLTSKGTGSSTGNSGGYSGSGVYAKIRSYISYGNIAEAERLLNQISSHDAQWYFLMGAVCQRKGWYDEAARHFETAASMEPSNQEYARAADMIRQGGGFQGYGGGMGGGLTACDCCSSLICADCLCNCMGGRLCC